MKKRVFWSLHDISAQRQGYFEWLLELYELFSNLKAYFNIFNSYICVFIAKHIETCQYWNKTWCTEEFVSLENSFFIIVDMISKSLNIQPEEMHTY